MTMAVNCLLMVVLGVAGVWSAQPGFFERQGQDVFCYRHTANNLMGSAFFSKELVKELDTNLKSKEKAKFPDDNDAARRAKFLANNGAMELERKGLDTAPLYGPLFNIGGYTFDSSGGPGTYANYYYPVKKGIGSTISDDWIKSEIVKANFRGFAIHITYSQEWTHFTSIIKDAATGYYYYLDPCFGLVDKSQPVTATGWGCNNNVRFHPILMGNGNHDCRRYNIYEAVEQGLFEYLVSHPIGTITSPVGIGTGENAVVTRINRMIAGYGTSSRSKIVWMAPIYKMTNDQCYTLMRNDFSYWKPKHKLRIYEDRLDVNSDFLHTQRDLWKSRGALDALKEVYYANYDDTNGGGFYTAKHTPHNKGKDALSTKTCKIQTTSPNTWDDKELRRALLAEWRRRRSGGKTGSDRDCASEWKGADVLAVPLINYEPNDDDYYNPYNMPYYNNYNDLFLLSELSILIIICAIGCGLCGICGGILFGFYYSSSSFDKKDCIENTV